MGAEKEMKATRSTKHCSHPRPRSQTVGVVIHALQAHLAAARQGVDKRVELRSSLNKVRVQSGVQEDKQAKSFGRSLLKRAFPRARDLRVGLDYFGLIPQIVGRGMVLLVLGRAEVRLISTQRWLQGRHQDCAQSK